MGFSKNNYNVNRVKVLGLLVVAALLPILSEAFMHHPGMYGNNYSNSETTKTTKEPKTQAEKLKDPWLWVAVIAFGICMYFCLKISFTGRWRQVCGSD